MKIQFLIIGKNINKNLLLWLLIMILISSLCCVLSLLNNTKFDIGLYQTIIGSFTRSSPYSLLNLCYHLCFTIYFALTYCGYEFRNSPEFIFNRCGFFNLIIYKIIIFIITLIIFRFIYAMFWYMFFVNIFKFPLKIFFRNLFFQILISVPLCIGFMFYNKKMCNLI